jgi:hypothetical protein
MKQLFPQLQDSHHARVVSDVAAEAIERMLMPAEKTKIHQLAYQGVFGTNEDSARTHILPTHRLPTIGY